MTLSVKTTDNEWMLNARHAQCQLLHFNIMYVTTLEAPPSDKDRLNKRMSKQKSEDKTVAHCVIQKSCLFYTQLLLWDIYYDMFPRACTYKECERKTGPQATAEATTSWYTLNVI